ncbi:substrate-binding periplasmic protein [Marinobacter apostichopi]|uniref:substrate-binding periplasmic protein n=1 Tax=Marinobacter apostichopi TaxID=3035454 RepID=UPI0025723836|nr:transporter substrate-binding domain-containing protein [Marinobacter sp. LA51]
MLIRRIIGILLMSAALPAVSETAPVLKVVTTEYPPFEYVEDGVLQGYDVDTVRTVLQAMGFEPKFQVLPWARAEMMVRRGNADLLFSLTSSPERERHYLFTAPISSARDVLYARKDAGLSWTNYNDLTNLSVGVTAGYSYAPEFMAWLRQGQSQVVTMNQENPDLAGLRMVAVGRVDIFICEEKACNHLINANKGRYPELSRVTALPGSVGNERLFRAAFSRQHPDARALRSEFNQALERLELEITD